jgi:hypothetical protein
MIGNSACRIIVYRHGRAVHHELIAVRNSACRIIVYRHGRAVHRELIAVRPPSCGSVLGALSSAPHGKGVGRRDAASSRASHGRGLYRETSGHATAGGRYAGHRLRVHAGYRLLWLPCLCACGPGHHVWIRGQCDLATYEPPHTDE